MPTVIETFQEFSERHGGHYLHINGRLIWEDGANNDAGDRSRVEPHQLLPAEVLKVRRAYYRTIIKSETAAFNKLRYACDAQDVLHMRYNGGVPAADPRAIEILKEIKAKILATQEKLDAITEQEPETLAQARERELAAGRSARNAEAQQRRAERAELATELQGELEGAN